MTGLSGRRDDSGVAANVEYLQVFTVLATGMTVPEESPKAVKRTNDSTSHHFTTNSAVRNRMQNLSDRRQIV